MLKMKNAKTIIGWVLGLLSAYMIFDGLMIYINTSGYVQGSEFGMLITLTNQISLVMIWLALFALWFLFPSSSRSSQ